MNAPIDQAQTVDPETARLIRLFLERIAVKIERTTGSAAYLQAYKKAARIIREAKPD